MPHLVVALTVSFSAMALTWSYLKAVRMPLLTYLVAYTGTTVIGAAALLDDIGLREFKLHQPMFRLEDYPLTGSMTYWILLLAPFFMVPLGATLGLRAANIRLVDQTSAFVNRHESHVIPIVYAIASACALYCLWKLVSTGAYFPKLYFDRTLTCNVRLLRRTELFLELRYLYYAFAYAAIPIGATVALLAWKTTSRHFDAAMFIVLSLAALYFNIVLYMKANLVVFFLILLFGCMAAKLSFRFLLAFAAAGFVALLVMQGLLGCYQDSYLDTVSRSDNRGILAVVDTPALLQDYRLADEVRAPTFASSSKSQSLKIRSPVDAAVRFARSIVFRMAASLPYYVQIFSNPDERCGIESNSLPLLPHETCYPATKVGTRVNPGEIQAFQSAPAHISAYAELGLGYAFIVLLLGGLIIGFGSGVSGKAHSPLFWSASAAVCAFAFYMTQAGLVGALTHSYGFVWYLFPLLAGIAIHAFRRMITTPWPRRIDVDPS